MPQADSQCQVSLHLKDQLFHRICKHIRDSIRYLYSNPKTTYSQLMVTTCKAESKMEEVKDNIRARSAATTEVVDGSKELGNQIVRLMAALTRAEQGNCPTSAPNSPRHRGHGRGQMDRNTPTCPSSHNGQTGLGQTTSTHSSSATSQVAATSQEGGIPKDSMVVRVVPKTQKTPTHFNASNAKVGVTWLGSVLLQSRH